MNALFDFDSHASGKVLFAEDFDLAPGMASAPDPEVIPPTFTAAEVEAARAEGFQAGHTAATTEAATADHAGTRQAVAAMAAQFAAARDDLIDHAEQAAAAIGRVLLGSLGAVLPELAARYGEAELQAVIRAVLPGLFKEPAVTLRVNPLHAAATAHEIERLDPDLAARLQIVPTDAVPPGDVRIAWRNGGASRDAAALWEQVTQALGLAGLAPQHAAAGNHRDVTRRHAEPAHHGDATRHHAEPAHHGDATRHQAEPGHHGDATTHQAEPGRHADATTHQAEPGRHADPRRRQVEPGHHADTKELEHAG